MPSEDEKVSIIVYRDSMAISFGEVGLCRDRFTDGRTIWHYGCGGQGKVIRVLISDGEKLLEDKTRLVCSACQACHTLIGKVQFIDDLCNGADRVVMEDEVSAATA